MVTITINEDTAEKARQAMIALLGNGMHEVSQEHILPSPPSPEKKSKAKSEPAKAAQSEAAPAKLADSTPPAKDAKADYKPVGELILKTVGAKGRDAVVALLTKYDARMGSQLKPEQYPAFMTECQALLDGK